LIVSLALAGGAMRRLSFGLPCIWLQAAPTIPASPPMNVAKR